MNPETRSVPDDERLLAFVVASAALERLPLEPAWQPAVVAHLKALHAAATRVMAAPLDDLVEAAPIFEP